MFVPLVPVRFSAPQFTPESASPVPALPSPGPSAGNVVFGPYEYVIASLAGPVVVPFWIWIQISNECVVAFPKFFTPSQSTTTQPALAPPLREATRIEPAPAG